MEYSYTLSGATPRLKNVILGVQSDVRGVPLIAGTAGLAGVIKATTTAAVDFIGVQNNVPAVSYGTAQKTDGSDNASIAEVIINPDAVYKAKLCGGATSGTDLSAIAATAATTTGLTVTFTTLAGTFDEGSLYCVTGANKGKIRRIASITTNVATLTVAFPRDIAIGDTFVALPFAPDTALQYVQLTSDLTEVNATVAVDTDNANFRVLELKLNEVGDSYAYLIAVDHMYGQG
tara:strand:+ start:30347 stop:31045 length:699 start_codon:yes stop_codon:yes gene_type:complete